MSLLRYCGYSHSAWQHGKPGGNGTMPLYQKGVAIVEFSQAGWVRFVYRKIEVEVC